MCLGTFFVSMPVTWSLLLLSCIVSLRWNVMHRWRVLWHLLVIALLLRSSLPHVCTWFLVLRRDIVPIVLGSARQ